MVSIDHFRCSCLKIESVVKSLSHHSNDLVNSSVTVTLSGLVAKEEEPLFVYETC